jgi:hypothetical protein
MPRKKPEELKSKVASQPANPAPAPEPVAAPVAQPEISYERPAGTMTIDSGAIGGADMNGDGHISKEEMEMHLEFKRKELEDQDAMRDAQRNMTWFALFGLLLYPFAVVGASFVGLEEAAKVLGSMAPTYFVAVAGIVAAFFGAQAYKGKSK